MTFFRKTRSCQGFLLFNINGHIEATETAALNLYAKMTSLHITIFQFVIANVIRAFQAGY